MTPALQKVVAGTPLPKVESAIWTDVRTFYTQRARACLGGSSPPDRKAAKVIALLNTARQHGFDPSDYAAPELLEMSQAVEKSTRNRRSVSIGLLNSMRA